MAHEVERPAPNPVRLAISGMTCDGCANTVTRVLARVPGVTGARVDFASGRAVVTGTANAAHLVAAVTAAGYGADMLSGSAETGA